MHTNTCGNVQFYSLGHDCVRVLGLMSRRVFQPLFLVGAVLVLLFSLPVAAQVDCIDPGGIGVVQLQVSNAAVAGPHAVTANIPANSGVTAIVGSCTSSIPGTCTITSDGLTVSWNGTIPAATSFTITYRVQLATSTTSGNFIITNTGTAGLVVAGATLPAVSTSTFLVGCLAQSPFNTRLSDQKPGSVLVFPYYTSITGAVTNNTRLSITNVNPGTNVVANQAFVHIFLIDGSSCFQTDFFVCLTPNATFTFDALSYDPDVTGYVVAVAVESGTGVPIQNNNLIGNAFVNTANYFGNYGAESFAANSTNLAAINGVTARLFFDGLGYDAVPKQFAVEIQSPVDVPTPFQRIITASLNGDVSTGALTGAAQTSTAQIFNQNEVARSVTGILTGTCQATGLISDNLRVAGKLSNLIPTGLSGSVRVTTGGSVGILLTPRAVTWGGIRTLHKLSTVATSLTIPVMLPPACPL